MDEVVLGQKLTAPQAMRLAVVEGLKGAGHVAPNPLVGCVILDAEMRLLATGYHAKYGHDHAEIAALKKVADSTSLQGAHIYVTLEPCAHEGKTPSCAKHLAQLPLASVVYGVQDPFPLVAGQGALILQNAGIATTDWAHLPGIDDSERKAISTESEELAEVFLHATRTQTPFVSLKVATSLDGKMAMKSGESKWITGPMAREYSHFLRAQHDAVLIGRNTFVSDNPSLSVRHAHFVDRKNKVILFDSEGRSLKDLAGSEILNGRPPENILVVVSANPQQGLQQIPVWKEIARPLGVQLVEVPTRPGEGFDLKVLLSQLFDRKIQSIYVEGGAQVYGSFLRQSLAQRLHLFMAPMLIGGQHGRSWTEFFGETQLGQRLVLKSWHTKSLEADIYGTGLLHS